MEFYLSTIDPNAHRLAKAHGLGLEIAQYCTAWNMDENFPQTDAIVHQELDGVQRRILHAPFNELFPCAIDPKARELARSRYRQALTLAQSYGASKVVIHGGYNPRIYYPVWYTAESVKFWRDFVSEIPDGMEIVLENVLEEEPEMLLDILKGVAHPQLRMCLDVGHVHAYSDLSPSHWLTICAPYLSHFHIHNNTGDWDSHAPLAEGTIPMEALLHQAAACCPNATVTLELMEGESSVLWLREHGFLEE